MEPNISVIGLNYNAFRSFTPCNDAWVSNIPETKEERYKKVKFSEFCKRCSRSLFLYGQSGFWGQTCSNCAKLELDLVNDSNKKKKLEDNYRVYHKKEKKKLDDHYKKLKQLKDQELDKSNFDIEVNRQLKKLTFSDVKTDRYEVAKKLAKEIIDQKEKQKEEHELIKESFKIKKEQEQHQKLLEKERLQALQNAHKNRFKRSNKNGFDNNKFSNIRNGRNIQSKNQNQKLDTKWNKLKKYKVDFSKTDAKWEGFNNSILNSQKVDSKTEPTVEPKTEPKKVILKWR